MRRASRDGRTRGIAQLDLYISAHRNIIPAAGQWSAYRSDGLPRRLAARLGCFILATGTIRTGASLLLAPTADTYCLVHSLGLHELFRPSNPSPYQCPAAPGTGQVAGVVGTAHCIVGLTKTGAY